MSPGARSNGIQRLVAVSTLAAVLGCQPGGLAANAGAGGGGADGSAGAPAVAATLVVVPTGEACTPTGKHFEHRSVPCTACHLAAGALCFDPSATGTTAVFDPTTNNCSSIACHGTAAGTFTYTTWDWGLDQPVPVTVPYGGSGGAQANWYADAATGCAACHGYPPTYNGTPYVWHSGAHGGGNTCELCHPDATGSYVFGGTASPGVITDPSLHRNGSLDVTPKWVTSCFGCH